MSAFKKSVFWGGLACVGILFLALWWKSGGEKDESESSTTVKREVVASTPRAASRGSVAEWIRSWSFSAGGQDASIDDGSREVEEAVKRTFLAYNRQDLPAFLAGWTDKGIQSTYRLPKEKVTDFGLLSLLSFRPYKVGEFSNTSVAGTIATTEVELTYGDVQEEHRMLLVRESNGWKIDQDEKLAAVPPNAIVVDVKLQFFKIQLDPTGAAPGTVAFRIANTDSRPHEFIVKKWIPSSDMEETIGKIKPLEPGKSDTLVLANLPAGRYIVLCNMVTRDAMPYAYGMRNEFIVQ